MEGKEFSRIDEKFLSFVEGFSFNVVREFHTDIIVSKGAENLVNFANLLLVFKVNWGIEVGYICLRYF